MTTQASPVFILNFHGVGTPQAPLSPGEQRVWIGESQFTAILDYLQDQTSVELTFDDSNESDFSIALPALQSRGMKAHFFVVAARIDQPGYLSGSQIKALLADGMVVGSHGMRHRPWARLSRDDLHEELIEARDRLQQITGRAVDRAACPFGSYSRRVIRALRSSKYDHVYTSDGGPARPGAFILPRFSLSHACTPQTVRAMISKEPGRVAGFLRAAKLLIKRWR